MPDHEALAAVRSFAGLAHLVVAATDGFESSPLPMSWQGSLDVGSDAEIGALVGHVAKPNPIVGLVGEATVPALVILPGHDAYVSPTYYPSKLVDPRVVPTWNYDVVHAHGRLQMVTDASWVLDLVTRLTNDQENDRDEPWAVTDAPPEYIDAMLRGIVGVELRIDRIEGKGKWSQNRSAEDQNGVALGLRADRQTDAASRMAAPDLAVPDLTAD